MVFLFDVPADPEVYTNRATWYAEHPEESTLAFYATDPMKNLVGPGIAQAEYGGALFLFPPRPIPDIWTDPRLDFADTLEERLLAAAFLHSRERHVAVVSPGRRRRRGAGWPGGSAARSSTCRSSGSAASSSSGSAGSTSSTASTSARTRPTSSAIP